MPYEIFYETEPLFLYGTLLHYHTYSRLHPNRPEKAHSLQLEAFKLFLDTHPEYISPGPLQVLLVLIGTCRNQEDENRVAKLKSKCQLENIQVDLVLLNCLPPFYLLLFLLLIDPKNIRDNLTDEAFFFGGVIECFLCH